jgi:hypothetical protein
MKSWKTEKLIFIDPEAKSAFQSLSYKDFEIGDFADGFPEVWAVPRHKPLE